ncbi:hypothetical protein evm_008915 [Chilo suppressalis]|nr:hypothetical protein evm_008915 [Chilo suppressalis]
MPTSLQDASALRVALWTVVLYTRLRLGVEAADSVFQDKQDGSVDEDNVDIEPWTNKRRLRKRTNYSGRTLEISQTLRTTRLPELCDHVVSSHSVIFSE